MLKRTVVFANPGHLSVRNLQLLFKSRSGEEHAIPIEDIGFTIVEERSITLSLAALTSLSENGTAVVLCNGKLMPQSLLLPLDSNHKQTDIYTSQLRASIPLKKNLWKQTVEAKIHNQWLLLDKLGKDASSVRALQGTVKSGDPNNREALAARLYWRRLFENPDFRRDPEGDFPNSALNYGYAVLRAAVARALTGSGLLPTVGIHHKNRYNAFCLADDIMEPFRPFIDMVVFELTKKFTQEEPLTQEMKKKILEVLAYDAIYGGKKRPLMVGLSETTASLARCFEGEAKKIEYPQIEI